MAGSGTSLSVRTRLALFTALMVALMLALGAIAVIGDQAAADRVRLQARNVTPALQANAEMHSQLRRAESSVANYLVLRHALSGSDAQDADVAQVLGPARGAIQALPGDLDRIDHLVSLEPLNDESLAGDLADRVASQRASVTAWRQWAQEIVPGAGEDSPAPPPAAQVRQGEALFGNAIRDSASVQASLASANAGIRAQVLSQLDRVRTILTVATLLAVLLALFVAWRTTHRLVGPIHALGDTIRRQVAGERQAWADTSVGAREIRTLAEGVNVLNREHLRLVDRQAQSLALLRAGNDVVATLARVRDPQEAVEAVAETIGRTLGVDTVRIAGWCVSGEPYAGVWSRTKAKDVVVPEEWWRSPGAGAPLLPAGELVKVGADPGRDRTDPPPGWVSEDPIVARSASSLFLPIAVGSTVTGLLSVHSTSDRRTWEEPEVAYLQRVTRELARLSSARHEA